MKISHRRLKAGLRHLGATPSAAPDAEFVARLDLHLRTVDLDDLLVAVMPARPVSASGRSGLSRWWSAEVSSGRRAPLRLVFLTVGATFATAAAAAAFVIAQPATRVKVDDPAQQPAVVASVTTASTTAGSTTTVVRSGGNGDGVSAVPVIVASTTTATTVVATSEPTTAVVPTTTEMRRVTTTAAAVTTTKATEPPHPNTADGPGAPIAITLTCTGRRVGDTRSVLCEWSAVDGAASYRVLRGDGRLLTPVKGARRYEDLAVTGEVTYTYLAQAVGSDGVTLVANSNRATVACCTPA